MKRALLLLFLVLAQSLFAQSAGFNNTFIVLSINSGGDLYYDLNAATGNPDFNNAALGTFCQGSSGIVFKGGEHKVYKCGGCDITSTRIYYRIYLNGTTPGNFVSNNLGYTSGFNNGCGGADQTWSNTGYNINLLSGLAPGNYTLEVYSDMSTSCWGTQYASNSGANYKAFFTVNATAVGGTVDGGQQVCSGSIPANLTLNGYTGNVMKWQRSISPDFTSGVSDIAVASATLAGSSIGAIQTDTYFRAIVKSGVCSEAYSGIVAITLSSNMWTGAANGDWNTAANWSCGFVPDQNTNVVISGSGSHPQIASGNNAFAKSLSVEDNAVLTIADGANLTVTNAVAIANTLHVIQLGEEELYNGEAGDEVLVGAKLIVENNANLVQVNDVENSGLTRVEKNSAPVFRLDFTMWSSPVSGETLLDFSPQTLSNRFYRYNPLSNSYNPIPGGTSFEEGRSYLIRVANTHPAYVDANSIGTPWTGVFTGVLNNGNVNVAVTPHAAANGETAEILGYNAIGNPYPSPINISDFYAANAANLGSDSMIYLWRKRNGTNTTTYASLNLAGYTANNGNAYGDAGMGLFDDPDNSDEWVLNPGQGFIVQAASNTIVFTNSMRRTINNGQLFSTPAEQPSASRLWLNLTGANGEFSQAMVAYLPEATLGIDYGYDGRALLNDAVVLYSLAGDSKLGIQARPAFNASDILPLGYKADTAGTYTIALDHTDGVFHEGQGIFLRDNFLGLTHDIRQGAYDFTTEAGSFTGRFDIVYGVALGVNPAIAGQNVVIYQNNGALIVNSGPVLMKDIVVYDIAGRVLYKAAGINTAQKTLEGFVSGNQLLIVKVNTADGETTKKIFF